MEDRFTLYSRREGSALLIVLGCVALLTILVTAFLLTAGTEFTTSNFYAKGVNTKLLSENVINLVMAQLREGARSTDLVTGTPVAWASQPGMIRTYDAKGANDPTYAYKYFKLYSWDNMVGTGHFDESDSAETPPTGWSAQPNVYTDLNEPVNGTYPIIDPAAAKPDGSEGPVEGFSFTPQAGTNPLSMPVKWLYVLKDGTVAVGATTGTGTAVKIPNASSTNPVIGRVAFWTDDETSKVNINTASEGIFWDQPVANNPEELGTMGVVNGQNAYVYPYGFSTAVAGSEEFQRMPGHPATTSLSTVFGYGSGAVLPDTSLTGSLAWPLTQGASGSYATTFAPYYMLTPRYASGASLGGTQVPTALTPPDYRLYDSVDELNFDPSRMPLVDSGGAPTANSTIYLGSNGISPTGRSGPSLKPSVIDQRRFFITAHSRAPEETLFGTPRISLWPEQASYSDPSNGAVVARTAKDNLLAFCSTIANQPYYFQRASYYLYQGASGAALGGPALPSSQSSTADFPNKPTSIPQTGVERNENIYAYLQALTSANIPGFGGNFLAKYPGGPDATGNTVTDRDEILTEMFDLLRSGVNTINVAPGVYPNFTYTLYPLNAWGNPGCGSTVPISIPSNGTHGFGRTYNVAEVGMVFLASRIDLAPSSAVVGTPDSSNPARMCIGTGLPYAYPIDYGGFFSSPPWAPPPALFPAVPKYLYWDPGATAASPGYGVYPYNPLTPTTPPVPGYGAYVYESAATTGTTAMLVPIDPTTNQPAVDSKGKPVPLSSTACTIGDPQTTAVQAYILVRVSNLVSGTLFSAPKVRIRITNLDQLTLNGTPMGFPAGGEAVSVYDTCNNASQYTLGGLIEPCQAQSHPLGNNDGTNQNFPFVSVSVPLSGPAYPGPYGGEDPIPGFSSSPGSTTTPPPNPVQIHGYSNGTTYTGTTMLINGTTLKIDVLDGSNPMGSAQVIQTVYVKIPQMTLPVPSVEMAGLDEWDGCSGVYLPEFFTGNTNKQGNGNTIAAARIPGYGGSPSGTPPTIYGTPLSYYWQMDIDPRVIANRFYTVWGPDRMIYRGDVIRSFEINPSSPVDGDARLMAANPIRPQPSGYALTSPVLSPASDDFAPLGGAYPASFYPSTPNESTEGPYTNLFIRQLHSLTMSWGNNLRYLLGLVQTAGTPTTPPAPLTTLRFKNLNGSYGGNNAAGMGQTNGALLMNTDGTLENFAAASAPVVTPELRGAYMDAAHTIPGDWTDGMGPSGDGPIVAKPDEGAQGDNTGLYANNYFETNQDYNFSATTYAPNRQVPSPIIFGTLPSRIFGGLTGSGTGGVPWCTLLFCPNPSANDAGQVHPGFGVGTGTPGPTAYPPYVTPPDHLWLDLFWMPVVEPYAISEPFSTAGKVNMNYEIVPFGSYIHRSTAVHSVLKSTRILAISNHANDGCLSTNLAQNVWPNVKALSYATDEGPTVSYRYGINLPATIDDFESSTFTPTPGKANAFYDRFITQRDIFRSASEICNAYLVPYPVLGESYVSNTPSVPTNGSPTDMNNWWSNFKLTGDNGRESPYNQIYPRLTTKSNTFQIHMRVQVLSQTVADRSAGTFDTAGGDSVVGEYRGSAIVERYLDSNQANPPLPDFATTFPSDATSTVDNYVHYRVVSTRAFTP